MIKQVSFISLISLISLSLSTPCFSGFYVGAGGGLEGASFSQKSRVIGASNGTPVDVNVTGAFDVLATNHLAGVGGFGTVFGGYEWRRNQYYVAGELNANLSSLKYSLTNDEFIHQNFAQTSFTMKTSEGISILPGIFLTNSTLLYGRIGYANGRLKIFEGADPSIENSINNLSGVRYGLGMSQEITPQWAFRLDYSQINYRSVKSYTSFPSAGVTKATRITPLTAQIAFDILYHFDKPVVYSK